MHHTAARRAPDSPSSANNDAQLADARALLGVAADATPKQLQEAYAREALRWHPDRHIASPSAQAAASPRFQAASEALDVLLRAEAERTGVKTWVFNYEEKCWEWGLADEQQQEKEAHAAEQRLPYDGSQGFSPSQSYRPPWADGEHGDDAARGKQKVHDGAWWNPSWDEGADDDDGRSNSNRKLWYLMLPVIGFLLLKNAVAVAFISAGPMLALAPEHTVEQARAAAEAGGHEGPQLPEGTVSTS